MNCSSLHALSGGRLDLRGRGGARRGVQAWPWRCASACLVPPRPKWLSQQAAPSPGLPAGRPAPPEALPPSCSPPGRHLQVLPDPHGIRPPRRLLRGLRAPARAVRERQPAAHAACRAKAGCKRKRAARTSEKGERRRVLGLTRVLAWRSQPCASLHSAIDLILQASPGFSSIASMGISGRACCCGQGACRKGATKAPPARPPVSGPKLPAGVSPACAAAPGAAPGSSCAPGDAPLGAAPGTSEASVPPRPGVAAPGVPAAAAAAAPSGPAGTYTKGAELKDNHSRSSRLRAGPKENRRFRSAGAGAAERQAGSRPAGAAGMAGEARRGEARAPAAAAPGRCL